MRAELKVEIREALSTNEKTKNIEIANIKFNKQVEKFRNAFLKRVEVAVKKFKVTERQIKSSLPKAIIEIRTETKAKIVKINLNVGKKVKELKVTQNKTIEKA